MSDDPAKILGELLNDSGMEIRFGLCAQGHIPTIERMLADGESWTTIGKVIGWHPATARAYYFKTSGDRGGIQPQPKESDSST